ncbi:uncharacterized serine-rich protein C215.13-like [Pararge aegeria]|nr:uncharacterized serine-rich protein C215.13-like [Pararge aegeria]XP_039753930.1 uncharacterized serine-rich protein C215.13-like [Pararge aegeria]XP_039754707.1 uncharacterized serine-rich protein C215.13-like [Pararge aegeria]XP_039755189.1 uncharacterized serine-rich protein C215.13-like [Pararge aegeria]XP_039758427.1 uncharacterized serine-rich protein C215.13-like [Pararge aegeria]XP_039759157.1 uncharacterized serine-rich protein C215.13-like [Pararge aegeria]XP_039762711.1 uncharac
MRTVVAKMNANYIDTGRLIEEVRFRPLLWDPSNELYKNKDAKNKAWEEVGEAIFGENYIKKDKDKLLRQRWKSARDGYFKTKANMKKAPSGSGAKTVTKYIYFKELNFLDRITENEVSESMYNINEQSSSSETIAHVVNNDEISGSSQNSSTPVADQDKPTWTRKRKHERVQENSAFEKKLVDLLDKNMPDISSDDLSFFNSLGPILKSFNSYKKLLFRSKVLQIAMDLSAPTSSGTTSTSNILSPEHNSNSTTTSTTNHSNDTTTQRGYQSASQYYTVMSPENDSNSSVMCATNSSYFSNQTLPVNESMSSTTTQQGYQTANQYDPHSTVNNSVQQSCEEIQHFPNIASENDNFY